MIHTPALCNKSESNTGLDASKTDNQVTFITSKLPPVLLSHPPRPVVAPFNGLYSDLSKTKGITLSESEFLSLSNARASTACVESQDAGVDATIAAWASATNVLSTSKDEVAELLDD